MRIGLDGHQSSAEARALAFAAGHYPACDVHRREAVGVYLALEGMVGEPLALGDLDTTVGDILTKIDPRRKPPRDSLEVIEANLALEEELARPELARLALLGLADESVMKPLLGPAGVGCQWDPATVWVRSVRGIINERARHSGNCACGKAPSNNEMQLTRSGHPDGGPCS